jgi:hypothetical protein
MTGQDQTGTLHLRRLAWAGVEIRLGGTRLPIDPLEHAEPLAPVMGPPRRPLPPRSIAWVGKRTRVRT